WSSDVCSSDLALLAGEMSLLDPRTCKDIVITTVRDATIHYGTQLNVTLHMLKPFNSGMEFPSELRLDNVLIVPLLTAGTTRAVSSWAKVEDTYQRKYDPLAFCIMPILNAIACNQAGNCEAMVQSLACHRQHVVGKTGIVMSQNLSILT